MANTIRMTIEEALEALKARLRATNSQNLNAALADLKQMTAYLNHNVTVAMSKVNAEEISPAQVLQTEKNQLKNANQKSTEKSAPQPPSSQTLVNNASQQLQQANSLLKQIPVAQQKPQLLNPLYGSPQQQRARAVAGVNAVMGRVEQASQYLRQLPPRIQQNFMDDTAVNQAGGQAAEQVMARREQLGVNPTFRWREAMDNKPAEQNATEQPVAEPTPAPEQPVTTAPEPQPGSVANDAEEQQQAENDRDTERKAAASELEETITKEAIEKEAVIKTSELEMAEVEAANTATESSQTTLLADLENAEASEVEDMEAADDSEAEADVDDSETEAADTDDSNTKDMAEEAIEEEVEQSVGLNNPFSTKLTPPIGK